MREEPSPPVPMSRHHCYPPDARRSRAPDHAVPSAVMSASRTVSVAALLLLAACSHSPAPSSGPSPAASADPGGGGGSRAIAVEVDNQNFNDMNVYLMRSGSKWLVGHAPGLSKTTLTIPASVAPGDQRV